MIPTSEELKIIWREEVELVVESGYEKYRGKCRERSEQAVYEDPKSVQPPSLEPYGYRALTKNTQTGEED